MRARTLAALALLLIPTHAAPPSWMHVIIEGRSAENSTYLEASFFYQLQTLLGTEASSPKVLESAIVRRQRKELYINLDALPPAKAGLLRNIAGKASPVNITLGEIAAYMDRHYYEITRPYPNLQALLAEHPYRDNPNWLTVPVDSATFHHRRVLHIQKDRIADALMSYFDNKLRLIYPQGTVIAADSFDPKGNFIETEVLRKRLHLLELCRLRSRRRPHSNLHRLRRARRSGSRPAWIPCAGELRQLPPHRPARLLR